MSRVIFRLLDGAVWHASVAILAQGRGSKQACVLQLAVYVTCGRAAQRAPGGPVHQRRPAVLACVAGPPLAAALATREEKQTWWRLGGVDDIFYELMVIYFLKCFYPA